LYQTRLHPTITMSSFFKTNNAKEGSENPPFKTQERFVPPDSTNLGSHEDLPSKTKPQKPKGLFDRIIDKGTDNVGNSIKDAVQSIREDIRREVDELKKDLDQKIENIEKGPTMSSIRESSETFKETLNDTRNTLKTAETKFASVVSTVRETLTSMTSQHSNTKLGIAIVHVLAQMIGAAFICYKVKTRSVRAVAVSMAVSALSAHVATQLADTIEIYLLSAFEALLTIFSVAKDKAAEKIVDGRKEFLATMSEPSEIPEYDSDVRVTSGEEADPTGFLKNGTKSLFLVFASLLGAKVDPEKIDFGDIKKSAGFTRDLKGMAGFLTSVMGMARTAVDGISEAVTGVPVLNRANKEVVEEAMLWMIDVQDKVLSLGDEQLAMTETPETMHEIISLHEQGLEIGKKIDRLKGPVKFHQFYKIQDQLRAIYIMAKRKKMTSGLRNKPVTIMLTGPPGTGKSAMSDYITAFCQYQDGVPFTEYSVYKKNRDSEYWEGYYSQYTCEVEELVGQKGASGKASDQKFTDTMFIIDAATDRAYPLNMAFGGKGTTYFHSNLIITSSNLLDPNAQSPTPLWPVLPIAEENALKSRFDFLAVVQWKAGYGAHNARGTNTKDFDINAWEIKLFDPVTIAPLQTCNAMTFFKKIYTKLCNYRDFTKKSSPTRHILNTQSKGALSNLFGPRNPILVQSGEDEQPLKPRKTKEEKMKEAEAEARQDLERSRLYEKEINEGFEETWKVVRENMTEIFEVLDKMEKPFLEPNDVVENSPLKDFEIYITFKNAVALRILDEYMRTKGQFSLKAGSPVYYYKMAESELEFKEAINDRLQQLKSQNRVQIAGGDFSDIDTEDPKELELALDFMERYLTDRKILSEYLLTTPGDMRNRGFFMRVLGDFPEEQRDMYGALMYGVHLRNRKRNTPQDIVLNLKYCLKKWKEMGLQCSSAERNYRSWRKLKKQAAEWKKVKLAKLTDIVGEDHLPLKIMGGLAVIGAVVGVAAGAIKLFTMMSRDDEEEEEELPEAQSIGVRRPSNKNKKGIFAPRKMKLKDPVVKTTGMDSGAIDVSENVVRPNTYHLVLVFSENSTVRRLHGVVTFIKGRIAVTPAHVWYEPIKNQSKWTAQFVCAGNTDKNFEVSLNKLRYLQDGDNDLLFLLFPPEVREHKDITNHWMTDEDIQKMKGLHHNIGICCPREKSFTMMTTDKMEFLENCVASDEKNDLIWTTPNSFRAQMPTLSGDSGSIVIYYGTHFVRKIFGMNLAGNANEQMCYFAIITKEMLDEVIEVFMPKTQSSEDETYIDQVREEFEEFLDEEASETKKEIFEERFKDIKFVGCVKSSYKPRDMAVNDQVEGPASGLLIDILEVPCTLRRIVGPDGNTPLEREVVKSNYKPKDMTPEVKKVYENIVENIYEKYHYKYSENRLLTLKETLNGVPSTRYLRSMAANKSPGFPYTVTKEKFYIRSANGELHLTPFGEAELIRIKEKAMKNGKIPAAYRIFLKDERKSPWFKISNGKMEVATIEQVTERKIEDPKSWHTKTRSICGAPETLKLLTKQYFGMAANQIITQDMEMPSGTQIGMNPHSLDTHHLYIKLARLGSLRVLAGDYVGFEHELNEEKVKPHFDGMRRWYDKGPNKSSPVDDLIREAIGNTTARPVVIVDGVLLQYEREPSGHWLTALLNSKVNEAMMKTALYFLMRENGYDKYCEEDFDAYFCVVTLGDDNVLAMKAELTFVTLNALCDKLKECFGAKMTDYRKVMADYPERWPKYHNLHEIEFLKRQFVQDEFGWWHMALRKTVIFDMINWVSKGLNPIEATRDNMIQSILESFHWGPQFFDQVKDKCNRWLSHRGVVPITYRYHSLMNKYLSGSLEELLPEDKPNVVQSLVEVQSWEEGTDEHGVPVPIHLEEFPMRTSYLTLSDAESDAIAHYIRTHGPAFNIEQADVVMTWCVECRGYGEDAGNEEYCSDRHEQHEFVSYDCWELNWPEIIDEAWEKRYILKDAYFYFYEPLGFRRSFPYVLGMLLNKSSKEEEFDWDRYQHYIEEGITFYDPNCIENWRVNVQSGEDFQEGQTLAKINEKTEMAEFADQTSITVERIRLTRSSYTKIFNPLQHENWEQVLSRVVNKTFSWTPSQGRGFKVFELDFPKAILEENEYMWEIVRQYQRFSASIHLEFRINSTQFHSGALAICYLPHLTTNLFTRNTEFFTAPTPLWVNAAQAGNMEHRVVSANTPTVVTVDIPYVSPSHFWNPFHWKDEQMKGFFGRCEVWVLSQLMNSQDTASPVTVSVFMSFRDIVLTGPTIRGTKVTSGEDTEMSEIGDGTINHGYSEMEQEQVKSTKSRIISQAFGFVANVFAAFRVFPVVSGISTAVSLGARGISLIARAAGRNKPTTLAIMEPRLLQTTDSMVFGMGNDGCQKFAMDPQNIVATDPKGYADSTDWMLFDNYKAVPGIVKFFTVAAADEPGAILTRIHVSPTICQNVVMETTQKFNLELSTHLSYLSSHFKYWTGSMNFYFMIFATKFVSGRLRVTWAPSTHHQPTTGLDQGAANMINQVYDFNGDTQFMFNVPYLALNDWCRCVPASQLNTMLADDARFHDATAGTLLVSLANKMAYSMEATTAQIDVVVYASGGPDMRFAVPSSLYNGYKFHVRNMPAVQSAEDWYDPRGVFQTTFPPIHSGSKHIVREKVEMGEEVMDFKTLFHRYTREVISDGENETIELNAANRKSEFAYSRTSQYAAFKRAFLFHRGSERFKSFVFKSGTSMLTTQFVTLNPNNDTTNIEGNPLHKTDGVSSPGLAGTMLQSETVRPVIEFEVPYYSINMMRPGDITDSFPGEMDHFMYPQIGFMTMGAETEPIAIIFSAMGDDFTVGVPVTPPAIYYTLAPAEPQTGGNQPVRMSSRRRLRDGNSNDR